MLNDTVIPVTDGAAPSGRRAQAWAAAPGGPTQAAGVAPGETLHGLAAWAGYAENVRYPGEHHLTMPPHFRLFSRRLVGKPIPPAPEGFGRRSGNNALRRSTGETPAIVPPLGSPL